MTYQNLIYETDERVGIIKVNRPEVGNVFNWDTWMELEDALKRLHWVGQSRCPTRKIDGGNIDIAKGDCKRTCYYPYRPTVNVPGLSESLSRGIENRFRTLK